MALFALNIENENISGARIAPPPEYLAPSEVVIDIPVPIADIVNVTREEGMAVGAYILNKKFVNGELVARTAAEIIAYNNNMLGYTNAADFVSDMGDKAVALFDEATRWVTDPKKYYPTEQRTWGKQEKVAEEWLNNWNNGTPNTALTDSRYVVLVNLCAGELAIAKADVTNQNAYNKATSIMTNSGIISPYFASLLGVLHGILGSMNVILGDLEAATITEATAISLIAQIDLSIIHAVAIAELGL